MIPPSALDRPAAFVGTTGSGKTFTAKGGVEQLLEWGRRVCVVDPTGVWWGLRTGADGKRPGFPVVIFGGEHADVPIAPDAGERLGELVAGGEVRASIVDISEMSGGEQTRFLTDFFETLYAKNREALHLVLDEADAAAPQNPMPEGRHLLGAIDKIARRGRVKGFRLWTITQRPAVLHKNLLSQVSTLVALRLASPQDRKAIEAWVQGNADAGKAREILDSLPGLDVGEGWVWCPSEGVLERVRFPAIATFDSSRTPEHGEEIVEARSFAAVDVDALRAALAPATFTVSGGDKPPGPKTLNALAEVATAAKKSMDEIAAAERRGYERGLAEGDRRGFGRGYEKARHRLAEMVNALAVEDAGAPPPHASPVRRLKRDVDPKPKTEASRERAAPKGDRTFSGPQLAVLKSLAWWEAMGESAPSREQVAAIVGWRATSGHLRNVLGGLSSAGLVTYPGTGLVALTDAGRAAAPAPDTGASVIDGVRATLSGPQRQVVDALLRAGSATSREDVAASCGWAPTSGHLRNVLGSLSTLKVVEYPGKGLVALQAWVLSGPKAASASRRSA